MDAQTISSVFGVIIGLPPAIVAIWELWDRGRRLRQRGSTPGRPLPSVKHIGALRYRIDRTNANEAAESRADFSLRAPTSSSYSSGIHQRHDLEIRKEMDVWTDQEQLCSAPVDQSSSTWSFQRQQAGDANPSKEMDACTGRKDSGRSSSEGAGDLVTARPDVCVRGSGDDSSSR